MTDPRVQALCGVPGCNRPVRCKGVCSKHYARLLIHGSPTAGAPERASQAAITAFLEVIRVYDGTQCLIWPFARDENGYPRVNRDDIPHAVHRWACELENGPAPADKPEAAHRCARGADGCVAKKHLRWADRLENQADMVAHGNSLRGPKNPRVVLTEDEVRQVRRLLGSQKQREIGAQFGVSQATISLIASKRKWGWLDG